ARASSTDPPAQSALVAQGACLASLPWLHTKFVVLLIPLTALLLWRLRGRLRDLVAVIVPIAISTVAWLAFFYVIYGSANPQVSSGTYPDLYIRLENIPRSLLGQLLDQKFGLLVYSPAYLLAAVGAWLMWNSDRRAISFGLVASAFVYVVASRRLYLWCGGS